MEHNEQRIANAVQIASDAFWGEIAKAFPEVKTGDFPAEAVVKLEVANTKAVKLWVELNSQEDKAA